MNPILFDVNAIYLVEYFTCMLEFLFGWILGVWMGQQLPLPSVQRHIEDWWSRPAVDNTPETSPAEEESSVPVFTGEMPSA